MPRIRTTDVAAAAAFLSLAALAAVAAPHEETTMKKMHAAGSFEVTIAPLAKTDHAGGSTLGRYSLDKVFRGELEATSSGEMLTAGTAVAGSAGYVAIERVEGALGGRKGTFVLQHLGRMARGEQSLTITVVPDSGTGELAGLEGTMHVDIDGKAHFYRVEYTLPERP